MKHRRPSPALVVSIVALVVACAGTATAATKYLITRSSQVKPGALTGRNLRAGSVDATALKASLRQQLVQPQTGAFEAFRKMGPSLPKGGSARIASLDLSPGTYAIFAKVNMTPDVQDNGLLNTLLKSNKTIEGRCTLDAAGDQDQSAGALVSPGSQNVLMLEEQITRTLGTPGTIALSCQADSANWHASDASIVAIAVGRSTRSSSTG